MGSFVYLSIDVDFWYHRANGPAIAATYLDKVAILCRAQDIPLRAMMNHQQMLPLVNGSLAKGSGVKDPTLINIDMHSDLADSDCDVFSGGTWIAYVDKDIRHNGHYHWIQGDPICRGECNGDDPIFRSNGRHKGHLSDWSSIQRTFTRVAPEPSSLIRAGECVAVGVVLSPSYCGYELEQVFHEWRKRWGIPYQCGKRNEYGWVKRGVR